GTEQDQCRRADVARRSARRAGLQPAAAAAARRELRHGGAGARDLAGRRARPRGRRERPPDGGLRAARLAALHARGDAPALSPRGEALHGRRRARRAALAAGGAVRGPWLLVVALLAGAAPVARAGDDAPRAATATAAPN